MTENTETSTPSENGSNPTETIAAQPMVMDANNLTGQQKVSILQSVHNFFSTFDRVPGSLTGPWSNALDALAVVSNSINAEVTKAAKEKSK